MKYQLTNIQDFMEMLEKTGKKIIAFGTGKGMSVFEDINEYISILCDDWKNPWYVSGETDREYVHSFGKIEDYIEFFVDNDEAKKENCISCGARSFEIQGAELLDRIDSEGYVILITVIKKEYKEEIIKQLENIDNLRDAECYSAFEDMHYYDRINRGLVIERIIMPQLGAVNNEAAWKYIENTLEEYKGYSQRAYEDIKDRIEKGEYINHWIEFQITTICTLRCKYCGAHMTRLPEHHHVPIEQVISDIDTYFSVIDDCIGVQLGSGEAVLYPWLDIVLEKLLSINKVKLISIVTNGIMYPTNEKVLRQLANPKVVITMSNYRMPQKTDATRKFYKEQGISLIFLEDQEYWAAMGSKIYERKETKEKLVTKFMSCVMAKECPQVIYEGKMYSCGKTAWYMQFCDFKPTHDYIEFDNYTDKETLKRDLIALRLQPFLEACDWCDVTEDLPLVTPGEQIEV